MTAKITARRILSVASRRARGTGPAQAQPPDHTFRSTLSAEEISVLDKVRPFTMTSDERVIATMDAVAYVLSRGVPGALVECGVWRGGSVLAMIHTLLSNKVTDRDIYLFDTFEGMTAPSTEDTSRFDPPAVNTWEKARTAGHRAWGWAFHQDIYGIEQVSELLLSSGYPSSRIHFVVGPVEATVPQQAPGEIAVLRLDTDWYESTRHELVHLYPRLTTGGVLIVDDYGYWDGCRRATDEYFSQNAEPVLLSRSDYTGRIAVKH